MQFIDLPMMRRRQQQHKHPFSAIQFFLLFAMLLLFSSSSWTAADVIDQLTRQGSAIIAEAEGGSEVRQCTCGEQHECVTEMRMQGLDCIDMCWGKVNSITKKPDDLKRCFKRTNVLIEDFVNCFESNVDACLASHMDIKIRKVNITELVRLATVRLDKAKTQLTKTLRGPIVKIIDTTGEVGLCVKECFLEKNTENGFCFDRKACQPLLVGSKTKRTLRHCFKMIDFKKEAGDICDCSVKAGLADLEKYCPMLKLIGGRSSQRTNSTSSSNGAATEHTAEHEHADPDHNNDRRIRM